MSSLVGHTCVRWVFVWIWLGRLQCICFQVFYGFLGIASTTTRHRMLYRQALWLSRDDTLGVELRQCCVWVVLIDRCFFLLRGWRCCWVYSTTRGCIEYTGFRTLLTLHLNFINPMVGTTICRNLNGGASSIAKCNMYTSNTEMTAVDIYLNMFMHTISTTKSSIKVCVSK